jgi:hypothetical protein
MSTMTATMAMAETATVMAMAIVLATAMMPLPPMMATTLMKRMAAIQGWQLDNGNWTTTMG